MRFDPPLRPATLLRRYKRFLADVRFDDGTEAVAHTNNTGRMTGCCTPGARVLVSRAPPGNKLAWRWHAVKSGRAWVCVDTQLPNRVVAQALRDGRVPELAGFALVAGEVRAGGHSRFDVGLWRGAPAEGRRAARPGTPPDAVVEVKNVTLREGRVGLFPDAPSERGRKHLAELAELARAGTVAALLPFVGRADVRAFDAAAEVDPAWAAALDEAAEAGVLVLPWQARVTRRGVSLARPLPWTRRPR